MIVTSTMGSKAINSLVGISARIPSSRDKIELEEVERALVVDYLPLVHLRERGLDVMLAPFLPLTRYSMDKLCPTTHLCIAGHAALLSCKKIIMSHI